MKSLLLTLVVVSIAFAADGPKAENPAAAPEQTVPAADALVKRLVTIRLIATNGTPTAEVTVPTLMRNGRLYLSATLEVPARGRRVVEVQVEGEGSSDMRMDVTDPDRPALENGDKGLRLNNGSSLFNVSTLYTGLGDYEVYRNQDERMVVTVK